MNRQLASKINKNSFLRFLRPFVSARFWKLNIRTIQLKRSFRINGNHPYKDYLQYYYSREANPYYEGIEDKWYILRPLIIEMADPKPRERILDLGTGVGFQAIAFAEEGFETLGIDVVMDRIKLAKQRKGGANLSWLVADAVRLPLPSDSFDVVSVSLALHDMPISVLRVCFAEIQRVARRRVVIAEPRLPDHRLFSGLYRSAILFFDESIYLNEYLDANIESMLERAGLHLIKRQSCIQNTLVIYACDISKQKETPS